MENLYKFQITQFPLIVSLILVNTVSKAGISGINLLLITLRVFKRANKLFCSIPS